MPYTLNKTNGTILTDILDNSIDRTTTDLALIGKNTPNYGEYFNENFIKLLENFASDEAPRSPIQGQLWFDTSDNSLKIYDGNDFKEFARPIISTTEPATSVGDFWFNNETRQLYFNDGAGLRLAGPIYTNQQGISGFEIATVKDINGNNHIIAKLKLGNILVGIFSNDDFTPNYSEGEGLKLNSELISGNIVKGFTPVSNLFKFNVTAARSESLVDAFGSPISVDEFVKVSGNNTIDGRLTITGANTSNLSDILNKPLSLGWGPNLTFETQQLQDGNPLTPPVRLRNNRADQDFVITVKDDATFVDAVFVKASDSRLGVMTNAPIATLDVNGDVNFRGNLQTNNDTINIFNANTETINFGGEATEINIAATTGNTTINNNLIVEEVLTLNGQNLNSGNTVFNLLNETTQTINIGDEATAIYIGANNGQVTFKNDVNIIGDINIQGIYQIDNVSIRNNLVTSIGAFDLEIGALEPNQGVRLIDITTAQENFILQDGLTFDNVGEIRVDPAFTGSFDILNTTVETINVGAESRNINLGNLASNVAYVNALSKLQTYDDLVIGDNIGNPGVVRSSGQVVNLFNTTATKTINMAQDASTVNIFGDGSAGSFGSRQGTRTLNLNATSTIIEGNLTVEGANILASSNSGSIFTDVTAITIGGNSAAIILGGSNTIVEAGLLQAGSTGNITLRTGNVSGRVRAFVQTSDNVQEFEFAPQNLERVFFANNTQDILMGEPVDLPLKTEDWWRDTAIQGPNASPKSDIPTVIVGGIQEYRTQFPVVISRNNFLVRSQLLLPNNSYYATGGILFRNQYNEVRGTSNFTVTDAGTVSVGGSIWVNGSITGASGTNPAVLTSARVDQVLEIVGNLTSTSVNKSVFTGVTGTMTIGGANNSILTLGSTNSSVTLPGRFRPAWKTVITSYDAYAGDRLLVDTTNGNLEIRLPPNLTNPVAPSVGDEIRIVDKKDFSIFVVEVIRNGNKINGINSDLTLSTAGIAFTLVYTGVDRGWCYDDKR
jgi:hypothetical protein